MAAGGIFFFGNLPVLMEIAMSTCQGKKAGLLQRKTAGVSEPVQVRKPCEEAARGRTSILPHVLALPSLSKAGKGCEGRRDPQEMNENPFRGSAQRGSLRQ